MSKIKKLLIKAHKEVFSEVLGNNNSLFKGEGYDFVNLREYEFGDDVRKIDWNITAKIGTPYVKELLEERELNVVVASMLGGSVYFGTKKFKQELIAEIVAVIGFSVIKNSDRLTSLIYADKLYHHQKASKKRGIVDKIIKDIDLFNPLGKSANYSKMIKDIYLKIKRKSIIFIIADFIGDIDLNILSKKHEVILIIVRDKFEERPQELGFVGIVDPSTNEKIEGELNRASVSAYQRAIEQNDETLITHCKKHKIRVSKIYTDDEPYLALRKIFGGNK